MRFNKYAFDLVGVREAYFLGLLYADGCVCATTHNRHVVVIGMDDLDVIENVRAFFQSGNKISSRVRKKKIGYSFAVANKHLADTLRSLGCVDNKSLIVDAPKIDPSLFLPFLMGVFDGDGSISINTSINSWKASIGTGSLSFFQWMTSYISSFGIIFSTEKRLTDSEEDFYQITCMGVSARYFLGLLYQSVDGIVSPMTRKHDLYRKLERTILRCGPKFQEWEIEYILSEQDNKRCAILMNGDPRNYGWTRSSETICHKRRKLNRIKNALALHNKTPI